MMGDLIVWLSVAFAVAFAAAWVWRPDLRAWLERPKYRFQAQVQEYDRHWTTGDGARADAEQPGGGSRRDS